ncbi:TonB C-terminal domain-containing protein [Chondromyces crocatus]|uniref:TonB-like protein n=1 Tax=Chondromyces crocatus TaxID=52 RepID=A0A0K1ERN5_CHOCO|nr:TonB C-terminal domain-containing protein [Chondromyces crocatus]AKT43506.1 tonB-like protein [Chondromyces crocatus]
MTDGNDQRSRGAGARVAPVLPPRSDFRAFDIAVALFVGLSIQVGAGVAISLANLSAPAELPEIDKGPEKPVRVIPVLDLDAPALKLGGKKVNYKLPDRWVKQTPKPRVEQQAFVSTKAGKEEKDIPKPEIKVADAGTEIPPPDAEVAKEVEIVLDAAVDVEVANVDQEGHSDGVIDGTETDPLKARAIDLYLDRVRRWFSSRFRVGGSGLPPEELTKYRPSAVIVLSNGTMQSYTLNPSGNAAFDAAARATLEGARGQSLPSPPENYPDLGTKSIGVTFVCTEKTCD